MAANDIFKFSVVSRFGPGQPCVNTFHYKVINSLFPLDDAQGIVDAWQGQVQADYLSILNNAMVLDQLEVRQVLGGLAAIDFPVGAPGTGGAADQLPPMDCALISWRTGLIGRANRGRSYLPAPFESFQSQGALTAPAIAVYDALADKMRVLFDPLTGLITFAQLCMWHTSAADSPNVTTKIVRNLIATQRRRRAD